MFCPLVDFQQELFNYLKNDVINFSTDEITKIYSFWKKGFDGSPSEFPAGVRKPEKSLIQTSQNLCENPYLLGIDFPTWFNTPDEGKIKIIVLGIDPLRNEGAFKNKNTENDVVIGTPYALHLPAMRAGRTKSYWNFINRLSEKNFVYLTDIYKTFFYTDKSKKERSYDYYRKKQIKDCKNLLIKEIKLLKPDLIITLGGQSYAQLRDERAPKLTTNVGSNIKSMHEYHVPVLPMIHLSGSVRKQTKINFLKENRINNVDNNFGESYFQIVAKYLDKTKLDSYLTKQ